MVSRSFCRFRVYSLRFSGSEKTSQTAMDSRKESMRSFLSNFEGIVKVIDDEGAQRYQRLIRHDICSKQTFKSMLYKLICMCAVSCVCELCPALNVPTVASRICLNYVLECSHCRDMRLKVVLIDSRGKLGLFDWLKLSW